MMRFTHILTIALISLALLSSCGKAEEKEASASVPQPNDVVLTVQSAGRLYVTEYRVHKIVTADDIKQLEGSVLNHKYKIRLPVGDKKIAIPIDGIFKAYVDFEKVGPEDITVTGSPRSVVINLPEPQVELTSTKVDHAGIREYRDGLRSRFTDAELAEYERQGRAAMIHAMPEKEIIATARKNAAEQLRPVLIKAGFPADSITIRFIPQQAESSPRSLNTANS